MKVLVCRSRSSAEPAGQGWPSQGDGSAATAFREHSALCLQSWQVPRLLPTINCFLCNQHSLSATHSPILLSSVLSAIVLTVAVLEGWFHTPSFQLAESSRPEAFLGKYFWGRKKLEEPSASCHVKLAAEVGSSAVVTSREARGTPLAKQDPASLQSCPCPRPCPAGPRTCGQASRRAPDAGSS